MVFVYPWYNNFFIRFCIHLITEQSSSLHLLRVLLEYSGILLGKLPNVFIVRFCAYYNDLLKQHSDQRK